MPVRLIAAPGAPKKAAMRLAAHRGEILDDLQMMDQPTPTLRARPLDPKTFSQLIDDANDQADAKLLKGVAVWAGVLLVLFSLAYTNFPH